MRILRSARSLMTVVGYLSNMCRLTCGTWAPPSSPTPGGTLARVDMEVMRVPLKGDASPAPQPSGPAGIPSQMIVVPKLCRDLGLLSEAVGAEGAEQLEIVTSRPGQGGQSAPSMRPPEGRTAHRGQLLSQPHRIWRAGFGRG